MFGLRMLDASVISTRISLLYRTPAIVLAFAYAVVLAFQHTIILADYPDWVYQGWLIHAKVFAGHSLDQYVIKPYPVPNSLTSVSIATLLLFFNALVASKILLVIYIILFTCVLLKLCAVVDSGHVGLKALIVVPMAVFSTSFWMGSLNYQWGLMFFCAYLVLEWSGQARDRHVLVLTTLAFFSHAVMYSILLAYILMRRVILAGRVRTLLALTPSCALAAWYMVGRFLVLGDAERLQLASGFPLNTKKGLLFAGHMILKRGPFQNFTLPTGESFLGHNEVLFWLVFVLSSLYVVVLGYEAATFVRRKIRKQTLAIKWDLVFFGTLGMCAFFVPVPSLGIADLGQRLMIPALLGIVLRTHLRRWAAVFLVAAVGISSLPGIIMLAQEPHCETGTMSPRGSASGHVKYVNRLLSVPVYAKSRYWDGIRAHDYDLPIFPTGVLLRRVVDETGLQPRTAVDRLAGSTSRRNARRLQEEGKPRPAAGWKGVDLLVSSNMPQR